jgi:hypothetical protein
MSAVASAPAANDVRTLQARVQTLESENRRLTSTLAKQVGESRRRADGLQGELARVQHLCNELTCAMVIHGVDPNSLSSVVRDSHRFDVAAVLNPQSTSTPVRVATEMRFGEPQSLGNLNSLGGLNSLVQGLGPAVGLPSPAYQLAPPTAPARYGTPTHHRRLHASPPDAFIPDALLKRLDASSALVQRLGSPASWERGSSTPSSLQRSRSALGMMAQQGIELPGDVESSYPAVLPPTPPPTARPGSQIGADGDSGGRRGRRLMNDTNDAGQGHPPPARVEGAVGGAF